MKHRLTAFALLVASIFPSALFQPAAALSDFNVYTDSLAANWQDWSWSSSITPNNNSPVHTGSAAIRVQYNAGWAGLSLRAPAQINTNEYLGVGFWVYGNGSPTSFIIQPTDSGSDSAAYNFIAPVGMWTQYTVTWAQLGNPSTLARLNWKENTGNVPAAYYVDDIRLIGNNGGAGPTSTPTTAATFAANVTLNIEANTVPRPIPSTMLGSNLPAWLGPTMFNNSTFRARVVASGATVLRIPGGSWSDDYGWLSCEMGSNVPGTTPCNWTWAARPTDFINVIKATNTQAMYVMNTNVTVGEAAAAVAFFNSSVTDPTVIGIDIRGTNWYTAGHWAQLRADHGNPQPLGIKLWEIGNEVYGGKPGPTDCVNYGWETTWTCDGTQYINGSGAGTAHHAGYLELRAAMRAIDASIRVGAVGHESPSEFANWMNEVIAAGGSTMDFVSIHPYAYYIPPANNATGYAEILAKPQAHYGPISTTLQGVFASKAAGRNIPLYATEFNVVASQDQDNGQLLTRMVNALFVADSIGQMMVNGYAGANQWDMMNGAAGNGTDYGLMKNDANLTRSPQYYAYVLWKRFGGTWVPVSNSANAATTLSVYAGRPSNGVVSLLAVNKSAVAVTGNISVAGAATLAGGLADVVSAGGLAGQTATLNGIGNPSDDLSNAPAQAFATGAGNLFSYAFAPNSITLLRVNVGSSAQATATPVGASATPTLQPSPSASASATAPSAVSETPTPTAVASATKTSTPTSTPTTTSTPEPKGRVIIKLDAQPDNGANFKFTGSLGNFLLDDVWPDDGDSYTNTKTINIVPGSYAINEALPSTWYISDITCIASGGASASTGLASAQIMVTVGGTTTCTFTNQRGVNIYTRKFNDLNRNGTRNSNEPYLNGWVMRVIDSAGKVVISGTTNTMGKADFSYLRPGNYRVCEVQQAGWTSTLPGTLDVSLGLPCYNITLAPGQTALVTFGNARSVLQDNIGMGASDPVGVQIYDTPDSDDDEPYLDLATYVAVDETQPVFDTHMFLPLTAR